MSPQTVNAQSETLALQLRYNGDVLKANTADLTQEDSLVQPRPAGNCLNWVVGHIVANRNDMLALVGKPPIWSEEVAARYESRSSPVTGPGEAVLPLPRILADFDTSQAALLEGVNALSPEDLAAESPWGYEERNTVGSVLAGLVFHEAYHVGQTGLLRRIVGKESPLKGAPEG